MALNDRDHARDLPLPKDRINKQKCELGIGKPSKYSVKGSELLTLNGESVLRGSYESPSDWNGDCPRRTVKNVVAVGTNLSGFFVAGTKVIATLQGKGGPAVRSFELLNRATPVHYERKHHTRWQGQNSHRTTSLSPKAAPKDWSQG